MNFIRWEIVFIVFLLLPTPVLAARTVSITGDKTSLFGDETTTLTASTSGFTDGETIYIKGSFYQEGSTNYFGYTQKDSSWIKNGESTTTQRAITIGSWDGKIVVKSDFSDSGFSGEGEYKLKLGFYYLTSGGNVSSINWSNNSLLYLLNQPDPTPTNSPTQTPTDTPTHTCTPKPTNTSTPTLTKTPTISPSMTVTPTTEEDEREQNIHSSKEENSEEAAVLGAEVATQSSMISPQISLRTFIIAFAFVGGGFGLLSLIFTLQKMRMK